nr:unnamed protein product [Callosobruchus analis]
MQRRKILNLQSDRRRLKARIDNLNSLLSYLQEQYGITESAASIMSLHYKDQENLWINDKCSQGRQSTRKFIKTKRYSHIAAKKLLKIVPSLDAFGPHIYDTDHVFETIKLILQKYFTKRIQHELKNMKDSNKRRRKILNLQSDRRRLKARIDNLNSLLSYLREQYGIAESAAIHLNYILRRCRCIYSWGRQSTRKFIKTKRYSHIAAKKLLKIVPSLDAFGPHIYDTDHVFETIKLILQKYFTKRIQHELKNMKDSNKRVRANLTKSLLF